MRLLPLAGRGIERAQAPVAVRLQRAHAEFLGQGEGLLIGGLRLPNLWRVAVRGEIAAQPPGPCLVPPFLVGPGQLECTLRLVLRLLTVARQEQGLAQPGDVRRLGEQELYGVRLRDRLLQQGQRLGDAPRQGIGSAQQ